MPIFNKIIESLDVKLGKAYLLEAQNPFIFSGAVPARNVLVQLNNGEMTDENGVKVKPRGFYFIPQGQKIHLKVGKGNSHPDLGDSFLHDENVLRKYLHELSSIKFKPTQKDVLTVVSFEVSLHNAFPFFPLLELPAFHLKHDDSFERLTQNLCRENEQLLLGKETMLMSYLKELVVMLCRYVESNEELHHHVDKLNYMTDKRLVDVVNYINENLEKDLSNKSIAQVAFVSEDYVGQFFKTLTNRNLQDYIEDRRLDKAWKMLKKNPQSVQEISHHVGFKDPAYFSRRFKLKFGINANAVKQGKAQIV